jgi:hypothetical protein
MITAGEASVNEEKKGEIGGFDAVWNDGDDGDDGSARALRNPPMASGEPHLLPLSMPLVYLENVG